MEFTGNHVTEFLKLVVQKLQFCVGKLAGFYP